MGSYQDEVKAYLAGYKRDRLGVGEDGIWVRNNRPYAHILPKTLQQLNIVEPMRADFWRFHASSGIKLHRDFHHLTSSQALAFNLFFPWFKSPTPSEPDVFVRALGLTGRAGGWSKFEHIADEWERTNFDFAFDLESGRRVFVEVKFCETEFGRCRADERHRQKLRDIYTPRLEGKAQSAALSESDFFANYQLMRNLSYADAERGDTSILLIPRRNARLREQANAFLETAVAPDVLPWVRLVFLEDLVESLASSIKDGPLATHLAGVREKYFPAAQV